MFHTHKKHSNNSMSFWAKTGMLTFALTVAIGAVPNFAWAGIESDPNLAKLENKFFQHGWPKDDVDTRLDRLEKLVFGEAKTGDEVTRLKNLVGAVPNLDAPPDTATASGDAGGGDDGGGSAGGNTPRRNAVADDPDAQATQRESQITDGSNYPAVTAMEKKLYAGKSYATEPVVKRLERLEKTAFGKSSDSNDLSDRVDALKSKTGIDVANNPPPNSDWADDDDRTMPGGGNGTTYHQANGGRNQTAYNPDDDPMFNNTRSQTRAPAWTGGGGISPGSGTYGGGAGAASNRTVGDDNGGYTAGGSYGGSPPSPRRTIASLPPSYGMPHAAPDVVSEPGAPAAAMGLSQQVALLEKNVLARNYTNEGLPIRLNRLESTVFAGQKPQSDMPLPDRVRRLMAAVKPSDNSQQVATRSPSGAPPVAPDYGANDISQIPPVAPPRAGISKIINGLGSLLSGGGMSAYSTGSNLVQDPSSGMLIDTMTGNMINPTTGQVVRSGVGAPMNSYSPYTNGFNNGLSPIGSPYGMGGTTMRFGGFGGSGIRFGGGSGMGMGGMGIGGMPIGGTSGMGW